MASRQWKNRLHFAIAICLIRSLYLAYLTKPSRKKAGIPDETQSFFLGCISTCKLPKFSIDSGRYSDKRILQSDWLRAIAYQSISIFISLQCLTFDSILFSTALNPFDFQEKPLGIYFKFGQT